MSFLSRMGKWLRAPFRSSAGTVAVEFALIVPFAIGLYAGGSYTSAVSLLNKKMQVTSYALINSVPYPRTVCSYRTFIEEMYSTGAQLEVARNLLAPFVVNENNTRIRYIETAPDADGKFTSRVRMEHTPDSGPVRTLLSLWSAFGGPASSGTIFAESANVTITNDIPVCPTTPLTLNFDPNASVSYFEVLHGALHNNTVTARGGVKFKGAYRPYTVSNLPAGLNLEANTGKYGVSVNVPCNTATNGRCWPVTLPATQFGVQDYRDLLYASAPASATLNGQFVVYYPMAGHLLAGSGWLYQGQGLASQFQPRPNAHGGFPVTGSPDGYQFSASGLPSGLWMDGQTGVIHGTTMANPLTYHVTVRATDARGQAVDWGYSLQVVSPPMSVWASPQHHVAAYNADLWWPVYGTGGAGVLTLNCGNLPANIWCLSTGVHGSPSGAHQIVGYVRGVANYPLNGHSINLHLSDGFGAATSAVGVLTLTVPPVSHWFEGWSSGQYAGDWFAGYTAFSGGSGNMSIVGCWAPPGMICGSDGWRHWFSGNPSPGSGTATIQFRDNVTGIVYTQQAWYSFGSRPIGVWITGLWGDVYNGGHVVTQWAASGGYGGYGFDCYNFTPQESAHLQCLGYMGAWDINTRTSCISVWDGYGQSAAACHDFWINPRPLGAWFTSGFNPFFCYLGCLVEAHFTSTGGVGNRRISHYDQNPWNVVPGTHHWDGTNGIVRTGLAPPGPTTIGVTVADDIGQAVRFEGAF